MKSDFFKTFIKYISIGILSFVIMLNFTSVSFISYADTQSDYDENNRQLDIGHVKSIKIYSEDKERLYEFAREISEMPMIAKSVSVSLNESQGGYREILLRELIKEAYTWE